MAIQHRYSKAPLIIAILALLIAVWAVTRPHIQTAPLLATQATDPLERSPLLRAINSGSVTVGYGGYPPYTMEDPKTGSVSGLSVDLVNQIFSQISVKVTWKKFNWSTMSADMKRGEIHMLSDPILQTIPRAREFSFTEPFSFVPSGIGIIRANGKKFPSFGDLNEPSVKVAVGLGLGEETFLRSRAPKADIIAVPVNTDTNAAANLVLSGRADVAIVTLNDARRFLDANPGKLEGLWMSNPPAYMPAGFALRFDDELGAAFLNVAIRNLRYTGAIGSLATQYKIEEDFVSPAGRH